MIEKIKNIFSVVSEKEYFGRQDLLDLFCRPEKKSNQSNRFDTFLWGGRKTGKTQLLKKVYNSIYSEKEDIFPFYFKFPCYSGSNGNLSKDFFTSIIRQYVGYLKKDPSLITGEYLISNLINQIKFSHSFLFEICSQIFECFERANYTEALSAAFSLPEVIVTTEQQSSILLLDDFQNIYEYDSAWQNIILNFLEKSLENPSVFHLITGRSLQNLKNIAFPDFLESFKSQELKELTQIESEGLWSELCQDSNVDLKKNEISHIVRNLSYNPFYIKMVVKSALNKNVGISNIQDFYSFYFDEISSGGLYLYFSSILDTIPIHLRDAAIVVLYSLFQGKLRKLNQLSSLHVPYSHKDSEAVIQSLIQLGLIEGDTNRFEFIKDDVLKDYVTLMYQNCIKEEPLSFIKPVWIWKKIKFLEKEKVRITHTNLMDHCKFVMEHFLQQQIPKALLDNYLFSNLLAVSDPQTSLRDNLSSCKDHVKLPLIVGTHWVEPFAPTNPINMLMGYGFEEEIRKDVVWIGGCMLQNKSINLLEAKDITHKLNVLEKGHEGTRKIKWVIAKEGFSKEALETLRSQNILTSNLFQVSLIREIIAKKEDQKNIDEGFVFELVLPVAEDTELVAARAAEEIAKKGLFDENSINQVKMAIVEACINAFEYSLSKNSKVHLKFCLENNNLTIFVENDGGEFDPSYISDPDLEKKIHGSHKRGWGIKIMQNLMDEVRFDRVDNFTRLKMVKYGNRPM